MGRTDEVRVILEVNAEMRRLLPRLVIDALAGWETRGNGLSGDYEGGIVHHTAFRSSAASIWPARSTLLNGRPDLDGPLCNYSGPWCTEEHPRIAVVAAFPANHAGASGGRSMGPLPVTTSFNKRALGLEIDYAGTSPMTDGQMLVAEVWARAVSKVLGGGSVEVVRAHMETSITGKWDPGYALGKTIDMAAFRRRAKARGAAPAPKPAPQPAPTTEDDMFSDEDRARLAKIEKAVTWLDDPTIKGATPAEALRQILDGIRTLTVVEHKSLAVDNFTGTIPEFIRYIDRHGYQINREKVPEVLELLENLRVAVEGLTVSPPAAAAG